MRHFKLFAGIGVLCIFLANCNREAPEHVAEKFLDHVEKGELEKAGKMGTEKTEQLLSLLGSTGLKDSLKSPGYIEFKNVECNVENDTLAKCHYQAYRRNKEAPDEEKLDLVKREGKWQVDMEKEGMDKDR